MSEHNDPTQSQGDAVARLRMALDRIAFAIEKRRTDFNAVRHESEPQFSETDYRQVSANINALTSRLRDVLDEGEAAPTPEYTSPPPVNNTDDTYDAYGQSSQWDGSLPGHSHHEGS